MDPSRASHEQPSSREELASALTHAIGLILSLAGGVLLLVVSGRAGDGGVLAASAVYGGSLVFLYGSSTLYHSVRSPSLKRVFRVVDHVAIFLLIAGTYTPITVVLMRDGWGWLLLALVWGLAVAGLLFKLLSTYRFHPAATSFYLLMGWLGVLFINPVRAALPSAALVLLLAGGLAYTGGIVFYGWHSLRYSHAFWHVFVLVGSACHYTAIALYVV